MLKLAQAEACATAIGDGLGALAQGEFSHRGIFLSGRWCGRISHRSAGIQGVFDGERIDGAGQTKVRAAWKEWPGIAVAPACIGNVTRVSATEMS